MHSPSALSARARLIDGITLHTSNQSDRTADLADLTTELARVATLLRQSNLAAAETACRSLLTKAPRNAAATHLLGLIRKVAGDAADGERLLRDSVATAPGQADFRANLANLLRHQGRLADRFREAVFKAVPAQLKIAISVGIGLFLTIIGLVDAGFVRRTGRRARCRSARPRRPAPGLAGRDLLPRPGADRSRCYALRVRGAILISIVSMTVLAIIVEAVADDRPARSRRRGRQPDRLGAQRARPARPTSSGLPDLQLLGEFNLLGSWENAGIVVSALFVFTLLLADFFDTLGTMTAVGAEAGLLDEEGNPPNTRRILVVDSLAAAAGGAASRLQQHLLHRVRVGRGRGRAHRPGQRGHRRAVPAGHVLRARGQRDPERGGGPGAGAGRLPDDAAGQGHRLGRPRDRRSRRSSRSC